MNHALTMKPIATWIKSTTVMLQTFNIGFIHEIRQTTGVKTKVHEKNCYTNLNKIQLSLLTFKIICFLKESEILNTFLTSINFAFPYWGIEFPWKLSPLASEFFSIVLKEKKTSTPLLGERMSEKTIKTLFYKIFNSQYKQ